MKKMLIAFDLDGTLIDSSHRYRQKEDGSVDVDYWLNNCTKENIMKDKLLPLSKLYFEFKKTEYTIICVTARIMTIHDFDFLDYHNLDFKMILHRETREQLDHELKNSKLTELFKTNDYIPFLAFDDKEENLTVFQKHGFQTFNAIDYNQKLL